MKKQINFPSIDQFRNVVANVNRNFNFVGLEPKDVGKYVSTRVREMFFKLPVQS